MFHKVACFIITAVKTSNLAWIDLGQFREQWISLASRLTDVRFP
jgi:hypothetical protein